MALRENNCPSGATALENAALMQMDPTRAEALRVAATSRDYAKALTLTMHSDGL
jgi:hypothetical protein